MGGGVPFYGGATDLTAKRVQLLCQEKCLVIVLRVCLLLGGNGGRLGIEDCTVALIDGYWALGVVRAEREGGILTAAHRHLLKERRL